MRKKVVVVGGGTGLSSIVRGLKMKNIELSAIVTMGDDGGSSGRLRSEFQIPPPGDIRNVLIAMSDVEPMMEKLMQYKFEQGNGLQGHSIGNLLLTAMTGITGDFSKAVQETSKVLAVKGKVIPVCNQLMYLRAEYEDGTFVEGESKIPNEAKKIKTISLFPKGLKASNDAVKALKNADVIVIGPGSLYTSIMPNLLFEEVRQAIRESDAKKIYVANIMTQRGETDNYTTADHIEALEKNVGGRMFDIVIMNNGEVSEILKEKYIKKGAKPVENEKEKIIKMGYQVIEDDYIVVSEENQIRHNTDKIADIIEILAEIEKKERSNL